MPINMGRYYSYYKNMGRKEEILPILCDDKDYWAKIIKTIDKWSELLYSLNNN